MICDKLKLLRENKKMSRQQVADALGISKRTLESYEYGQREPNIDMINKFADFYNVTTDFLLGRKEPDPAQTFLTSIKTDSSEFMKTYQELPEVYQDILIYAMKRLSEVSPTDAAMQIKQRHVERLGDIEDKLEQERQVKEKDETSCA